MQCQGQKVRQAKFCTCPEEVIEEALGKQRHRGIMFWFVPKELSFASDGPLEYHPGKPSAVSVGALEDTGLLLAPPSCWHKGNLRMSNKSSKQAYSLAGGGTRA